MTSVKKKACCYELLEVSVEGGEGHGLQAAGEHLHKIFAGHAQFLTYTASGGTLHLVKL